MAKKLFYIFAIDSLPFSPFLLFSILAIFAIITKMTKSFSPFLPMIFTFFAIVAQMTKMAIFPSTRRWHTRVIGANRCYTRVGRSMKSKLVRRSSNELHWSSSNVVELGVGRTFVEPIFSSSNQFVPLPFFTP